MPPSTTLVAAAPPEVYPRCAFDTPGLEGPTPFTVLPDNTFFGHLATWGTCHIGFDRQCVEPPHSLTDYAYFHLGEVMTDEGPLAVGSITMDTGHADLQLGALPARAHYDDTGLAVAAARVGEDEHGIWIAGAFFHDVTEEQVRKLRAAGGLSGDWRRIGSGMELVASLAVNVPGFPVPRPALAASGDHQTALVAAGVVINDGSIDMDRLATMVADTIEARRLKAARAADLANDQRTERINRLQGV